jgi:hypothetical protein
MSKRLQMTIWRVGQVATPEIGGSEGIEPPAVRKTAVGEPQQ